MLQSFAVARLRHADGRTGSCGLDEDGIGELPLHAVHDRVCISRELRSGHQTPCGLPHARVVSDQLGDRLIHARGARGHVRPHIGNSGDLKQALHRTILAVLPVQHGEHHVDALAHDAVVFKAQQPLAVNRRDGGAPVVRMILPCPGGEHRIIVAAEQDPIAVLRDADRENVVFLLVKVVQHGFRRTQRNLMLRRDAAEQHTNAQFFQAQALFSPARARCTHRAYHTLLYVKTPENTSIIFHNTVILTVEKP